MHSHLLSLHGCGRQIVAPKCGNSDKTRYVLLWRYLCHCQFSGLKHFSIWSTILSCLCGCGLGFGVCASGWYRDGGWYEPLVHTSTSARAQPFSVCRASNSGANSQGQGFGKPINGGFISGRIFPVIYMEPRVHPARACVRKVKEKTAIVLFQLEKIRLFLASEHMVSTG